MTATKSVNNKASELKLAHHLSIELSEFESLCWHFNNWLRQDEPATIAQKALGLTQIIRQAIDHKFEKHTIDNNSKFVLNVPPPEVDKIKAKLVRGITMTFFESNKPLPSIIELIAGVSSAGFGSGSFRISESDKKINLEQLRDYMPFGHILYDPQLKLLNELLTVDFLSMFVSLRIGVYAIISGVSLLPLYAAHFKMHDGSGLSDEQHLVLASQAIKERFRHSSKKIQAFFSRNIIRVFFEELFNQDTTAYSIFSY